MSRHLKTKKHQDYLNNINIENVSSTQEETTTLNYRKQMSKPAGKPSGQGIFRHYDSAYLKWLKDQLDRRESMDKLLSYRNDIIEANKRVNYRNQIDRINNDIQRDNLSHKFRALTASNKSI